MSYRKASWLVIGGVVATLLIPSAAWSAPQPVPAPAETDEEIYVQRDSWPETMIATRDRLRATETDLGLEAAQWFATAPLAASGLTTALFPEKGIDLDARDDKGKPLWKARPKWIDGQVHRLPRKNRSSTYLTRTIEARAAVTVEASLGSDDSVEVWLNDKKILSRDVARGVAPNQDRVDLAFEAGANRLLVKIYNRTGDCGFYFSLRKDRLAPVWKRMMSRYPGETALMMRDLPGGAHLTWFTETEQQEVSRNLTRSLVKKLDLEEGTYCRNAFDRLNHFRALPDRGDWLQLYCALCVLRAAHEKIDSVDLVALRLAVQDLARSYPEAYPDGADYLRKIDAIEKRLPELRAALSSRGSINLDEAFREIDAIIALRLEALRANPLLDFENILLVKRPASSHKLGLPQNWQGNCVLPRTGFDDEISLLDLRPDRSNELAFGMDPLASTKKRLGRLTTFFKPDKPSMIADVDLDFDASRLLFSSIGSHDRWQIFELDLGEKGLEQMTPGIEEDVDNYDACYLPDGRIIFGSTRCFQGVPCVTGSCAVANLFIMDRDGGNMRRLCFDQDHNWCPTVLNNGRVLYTRWEYSDTPHYFTRLLFHMNPDGTGQKEYYGSNSYWPNSIFYARPIPGHPTQVVGIVSGHHGVARMGELILFDPALGRFEADGVVQRIPGYGKQVEPVIVDQLVNNSWPRFLHPWPLSDKYFLVSCKPTPKDPWGLYLADVFDNIVLLHEEPGYCLFEPIPLEKRPCPPVIPDKVQPAATDAVIYMSDVYQGQGLEGVPRGTVKALRVYEFHYCYPHMGGHKHVAVEGGWDVHRILGTVPVHADGSASFRVPANTPIAVQPLDAGDQALQVMRSWFTAMPGEVLSCIGCHESQNATPPPKRTIASRSEPCAIEPWYGPDRGFSFLREVQPVLDENCVGCHNSAPRPDGATLIDLTAKDKKGWGNFTRSYLALHPYVRRPGPESDYHVQVPLEFHASTSELVQMLEKGHHGVDLDAEAWDRLITWIDLNVPDHGTWAEHKTVAKELDTRRRVMQDAFANVRVDPEEIPEILYKVPEFVEPERAAPPAAGEVSAEGWPFDAAAAGKKVATAGLPDTITLDLGGGSTMELVLVPAGSFVMGDAEGCADESPRARVEIGKPFYMGRLEVTRVQYNRFDATHHNGYIDQHHKDHTTPGYNANEPDHPVIRVSWTEAVDFCAWLAARSGRSCALPTEAQWEWACRAGSADAFGFGGADSDFAPFANLADQSIKLLAVTGVNPHPIPNPSPYEDFIPKDGRFDDGAKIMTLVGRYAPNAFGLCDMHGNVSEWTRSDYEPYPYVAGDGRNGLIPEARKVVRGGSWRDRPHRARSAYRLAYRTYQKVFNVGFRVVVEM